MKTVVLLAFGLLACSSSSSGAAPVDAGGREDVVTGTPDTGAKADVSATEASTVEASTSDDGGGGECSAARAQLLGAVDSVSTGDVTVLGTNAGATTLYVDASAGGINVADQNPWIFVNLATNSKVPVTDTTSLASTAWDLAFKRPVLYTNDGDGGPGSGGALLLGKDFADVTASDASSATLDTEKFFDAQCSPNTDPTGAALTTFSSWYDYDEATHILTPAPGTWIVRGGTGKLYKLAIVTYYATPDGGVGTGDGGTYVLNVEAL